jgi:oligopeptide/dipeptide ABC transporter ATP-binding protein
VTARPLVALHDVHTHFEGVRAVDGVDLTIPKGEILGLVGESGSGKTTLGRTILRLVPATSGRIEFDGRDVTRLRGADLRRLRRRMQMIFQDPYSSLSPRMQVASLLTEPYRIHGVPRTSQISVRELLEMVELSPELAGKYPHELSGGQARRVGVARALALQPEFLIADEPTAGLDVSAAAAVLNLMRDLARRLDLTYLIITHNLNVVGYIADRIAVMYLGRLAEVGPGERVLDAAAHPYTRALLEAVSEPDPTDRGIDRRLLLPGEIPSPRNPPPGCRFHTRCRFAQPRSREEVPELEEIEDGHLVACHFWREVRADAEANAAPPVAESPLEE